MLCTAPRRPTLVWRTFHPVVITGKVFNPSTGLYWQIAWRIFSLGLHNQPVNEVDDHVPTISEL